MNWSWQEVAGFCAFLGFLWEIIRRITNAGRAQALAIRENALAQVEAKNKAAADKQRTQELQSLVEIHSELIEGIHDHLSLPPEVREKREFYVRKATRNLEKKGFNRLESYHTDFT